MIAVRFVADAGQPLQLMLEGLSVLERTEVQQHPTELRRRQSALGRHAARRAVRRALDLRDDRGIDILSSGSAPIATVEASAGERVALSIAHSSRLAVAAAASAAAGDVCGIGVDLERIRPTDIAASDFAFCRAERALFADDTSLALAAWAAKEASWKALDGAQDDGPAELEVRALDLDAGHARVAVRRRLRDRLGARAIRVRLRRVTGPDGAYVVSVAHLISHQGQALP